MVPGLASPQAPGTFWGPVGRRGRDGPMIVAMPNAPTEFRHDAPRAPDPGSRTMATVAWVTLIVLVLGTVVVNQSELFAPARPPEKVSEIVAPGSDEFTLVAKAMVKVAYVPGVGTAESRVGYMGNVRDAAKEPVDQLRAAMVAWDLAGEKEAKRLLDKLQKQEQKAEEPSGVLLAEIDLVRRMVAEGLPALSEEEMAGLRARHGWFAELAMTRGLKETDPARAALLRGGVTIVATLLCGMAVAGVVFITGSVLCVLAIVGLSKGRFRPAFVPPAPGGSVFVETVAVFVMLFLVVMKLGFTAVVASMSEPPEWIDAAGLMAQWALVVVPLWPLLRRVSFADLRAKIGWHSGQGVMREIGAGMYAYLAGLPLLAGAMAVSVVLMLVYQLIMSAVFERPDAGPPPNRVAEMISSVSGWKLVLLFSLATVWAPLVEESLFRGALYRALRTGMGVVWAALISSVAFGVMHGYAFFLLMPVITLGFIFALTREWRGSLIGPMVAHGLHNASVLTLAIIVFRAIQQ